MKYTDRLKLKKPDLDDYVKISDINENMDAIDEEFELMDNDTMPGRLVNHVTGKTYKYGLRVSSEGKPEIIYEEVI